MNILVTGGAGFIGSHVVEKLIEKKYEVIIIDNLSTGKKENVNKKAKFYETDIRDFEKLKEVFEKEKVDVVVHNAAQISVESSINNPVFDANVNIIGTINILECMKLHNIKKVIFSSSVAVYGNVNKRVNEETKTQPVSPYGLSKLIGEEYIKLYNRLYSISYIILRYANVYGPRQNNEGVISIFIKKMLSGKSPTIYGRGEQTRDFVYVEDIAEASVNAININKNEIYLIGSGNETNIKELFKIIKRVTKFEGEPIFGQPRQGDIYRSEIDHTKAIKDKLYRPTPLVQGIKKTTDFYKNRGR